MWKKSPHQSFALCRTSDATVEGQFSKQLRKLTMKTKHTVTDSNGQVHKRTCANRVYTHAVVTHYPARPATEQCSASAAYSKAEWASSLELAEKNASRHGNHGEVEIIPAVIEPTKKLE